MYIKLIASMALAMFAQAALAQADPDLYYDGNWTATVIGSDGKPHASRVRITRFSGTWYGPTAESTAACKIKTAPITVQESNASALSFTVWGKTAGAGCKDMTIEMKPVSEKLFEGKVDNVGTIRFARR